MYETEGHKSHRNISLRNIHHLHEDHVVVHYETRTHLRMVACASLLQARSVEYWIGQFDSSLLMT